MFDKNLVDLVVRQTSYDYETAEKKLEKWNGNHINVIKEYLNPYFMEKKSGKKKSTNQKIMDSIRGYMDDVNKQYLGRKRQKEAAALEKKIENERKRVEEEFQKKIKIDEKNKRDLIKQKEKIEKEKQKFENDNDGLTINEI